MNPMKNTSPLIPLQKTRLHEEIVAQLKDKIISREIAPGDKLPPERELAQILNVNRSTVRAAINKLESMELVEVKHGDGVYVKDYLESGSLELVRHMVFRDGLPDLAIIENLSHLRRIIGPEIARHAALNRSTRDLLDLEQIVFQSGGMPMAEKDWRVHNIITRASGNLLFTVLLNAFTGMFKDYASLYFGSPENAARSVRFHRDIYEAMKAGDADRAHRIAADVYEYAERVTFASLGLCVQEPGEAPAGPC